MYNPRKPTKIAEYFIPDPRKRDRSQNTENRVLPMVSDTLLTQQSRNVDLPCQGHLHSSNTSCLEKAIEESGGMSAMLFLVAKVGYKQMFIQGIGVHVLKLTLVGFKYLYYMQFCNST